MIQYHLTVKYQDNTTKKYLHPDFRQIVKELLSAEKEPLSVYVKPLDKQLYFERESFEAYANEHINQTELIKQTQTNGLYRNKYTVYDEHSNIDIGSLWKRDGNELLLVDRDRYVARDYNEDTFEEI